MITSLVLTVTPILTAPNREEDASPPLPSSILTAPNREEDASPPLPSSILTAPNREEDAVKVAVQHTEFHFDG